MSEQYDLSRPDLERPRNRLEALFLEGEEMTSVDTPVERVSSESTDEGAVSGLLYSGGTALDDIAQREPLSARHYFEQQQEVSGRADPVMDLIFLRKFRGELSRHSHRILRRSLSDNEAGFVLDVFRCVVGSILPLTNCGEEAGAWYGRAIRAMTDLVDASPSGFRQEYQRIKRYLTTAVHTATGDEKEEFREVHRHLDHLLLIAAYVMDDAYARAQMRDVLRKKSDPVVRKELRTLAYRRGVHLPDEAYHLLCQAVLAAQRHPAYDLEEVLFEIERVYKPEAQEEVDNSVRRLHAIAVLHDALLSEEKAIDTEALRRCLVACSDLSSRITGRVLESFPRQVLVGRLYLEQKKGRRRLDGTYKSRLPKNF